MAEQDRKSFNKWGAQTLPFMDRPEHVIDHILDHTEQVVADVSEISGRECFITYGTLLGAVRNGDLIPHDDDIDLAVWLGESDVESVGVAMRAIHSGLVDRGYTVKGRSLGQTKIHRNVEGRRRTAELFACWKEGDRLFHYFAVPGFDWYASFAEFGHAEIRGRTFLRPGGPETLLAYMYGPNWQTPDPYFKYELNGEMWAPFRPLFFSRSRLFWDNHYLSFLESGKRRRPSPLAKNLAELVRPGMTILELGSGLGTDALHLAEAGGSVTASDYSEVALEHVRSEVARRSSSAAVQELNLYNVADARAFAAAHKGHFDLVVARRVVEEVSSACEESIWELGREVLTVEGVFVVESRICRASRRPARPAARTRRTIDAAGISERARKMGLSNLQDTCSLGEPLDTDATLRLGFCRAESPRRG